MDCRQASQVIEIEGFRTPVTMEEPGGSDWEGEAHEPGETWKTRKIWQATLQHLGIIQKKTMSFYGTPVEGFSP